MQPMARINQEIVCKAVLLPAILHQAGDGTAHLRHRLSLSFRCVRFTWFEVAGPMERNDAWHDASGSHPHQARCPACFVNRSLWNTRVEHALRITGVTLYPVPVWNDHALCQ